MRRVAVITVRGDAKRLASKSIHPLDDKSLIAWSIDSAKNIPKICNTLILNDDSVSVGIFRWAGAYVLGQHPAELTLDTNFQWIWLYMRWIGIKLKRAWLIASFFLHFTSIFRT